MTGTGQRVRTRHRFGVAGPEAAGVDRRAGEPGARGAAALAGRVGRWTAVWYLFAVLLVLLAWEIAIVVGGTPDYLLPTPTQVAKAFDTYHQPLLHHSWFTLKEILLGFAVAVAAGMLIAVPIAFSRTVERVAYPLIVMTQAVPKVALGPLFIVWFGFGLETDVIIAVSVAIFPVIVNTALGLTSIDPDLVRLGRSMGGSRMRLFWLVRLPTALPSIFAGLKVAVTFAVIGAVVGEFIVGGSGLGYLTLSASGNQNVPLLFASVIALALIGVLFYAAIDLAERVVLRHHPQSGNRG
ncbi:ABC transporter permease [Actinacidiphila paucisporea]|uniref:NitT/TauT family transport system permease protein n=1 Tax=Actinacidiphila paucisporea TaxID=310782 RepID=A0A1M7G597_9ACTN|nr:ABC transporter permease [Actinacidiphila paucisporea]SHM11453.1 NitT/TauT family transport system permease protein [Actinacidiphila paucisporea]